VLLLCHDCWLQAAALRIVDATVIPGIGHPPANGSGSVSHHFHNTFPASAWFAELVTAYLRDLQLKLQEPVAGVGYRRRRCSLRCCC
jgi:hypothetical protein